MVSLFSIFDTGLWGVSWILSLTCFIMAPPWLYYPSLSHSLAQGVVSVSLKSHFNTTLYSVRQLYHGLGLSAWFLLILSWNSLGLLPYVFTSSAHISVSFSLALTIWLGYLVFGWTSSPINSLAALLPSGTPLLLMPFMVLIETISILIRPLTLAVRLSANMIAGHLLLSLCSSGSGVSLVSISAQTLLMSLELAVATIQAYVFVTLIALYSKEAMSYVSLY